MQYIFIYLNFLVFREIHQSVPTLSPANGQRQWFADSFNITQPWQDYQM